MTITEYIIVEVETSIFQGCIMNCQKMKKKGGGCIFMQFLVVICTNMTYKVLLNRI